MDGPGSDLLLTGGEIALESEKVVGRVRQPIESRFGEAERCEEFRTVLKRQLGELGLYFR